MSQSCPTCGRRTEPGKPCATCAPALDDETLQHGLDDIDAAPADVRLGLPKPETLFERKGEVRELSGLERRFAVEADGLRRLDEIARAIGVNVLKAQYLAADLVRRGILAEADLLSALDSFDDIDI